MRNLKKSKQLEKLYTNQKLAQLEKPIRLGWKIILLFIIIALIFGFLAGLAGGLIVLITRTIRIPFYKEFNLDEMLPKREITIKTREVISIAPDEQVEELIKQTQNQMVKIFLKKKDSKKILEQIYQDEESLGQGFILTSDGWIVGLRHSLDIDMDMGRSGSPRSSDLGLGLGSPRSSDLGSGSGSPRSSDLGLGLGSPRSSDLGSESRYVIATSDKKMYPIEKILLDPLTDAVFLKIKADGLEVAKIADSEEISLGQQVLVLDGKEIDIGILRNWDIKKLEKENLSFEALAQTKIESTDKFSRFIQLDQGLENSFIGSPVINLKGSVIGIVGSQKLKVKSQKLEEEKSKGNLINIIIPVVHFKSVVGQVLKEGQNLKSNSYLARPAMEIDYLDLAQARGITDKRFKDLQRGALIWGSPAKDSPAEKAGLKNADVILKVNNDLVNGRHNLTELIQEYKPGDKIELTILRAGKEEKKEVELGKIEY
jgi:S1-C subfamily serine protease